MKEITKFKRNFLKEVYEELEDVSGEDLEDFVVFRISRAIDKAYKIGKKNKMQEVKIR